MAATDSARAHRPKVKSEAEVALAAMGLSTSAVFRMLMSRIAADKRLPFDPFQPSPETVSAMKAARTGKTVKAGRSAKSLLASLDAE